VSQELEEYKKLLQRFKDYNSSFGVEFQGLKEKLLPQLQLGKCILASEELREFISVTRELREYIFNTIDTHILTIERESDRVLCNRSYNERNKKATTVSTIPGTTGPKSIGPHKNKEAITSPAPVPSKADFEKMSVEDLMKILESQQQKGA